MKRIYILAAALLLSASVFAQAPEKMSYQAVIRDASNNLVTSQSIGMQISILQGGPNGVAVYVETQLSNSNVNGLVSVEIGTGTLVSGDFTTIDWSTGIYYIQTETDPTGGISYSITSTSQLMSVPYALYAKTSGSSLPGPQGPVGANGIDGVDGVDGAQGPIGLTGAQGPQGLTGAVGATGAQGIQGLTGATGPAGPSQSLSISGNSLTISAGNTVTLPGGGTDDQNLTGATLSGTTLQISIESGSSTSVDLSALQDGNTQLNETQVDAFVADNGYLTSFTEVDGSTTNELQSLSLNNNNLSLSNGNTIALPFGATRINELSDGAGDDESVFLGVNSGTSDDGFNKNVGVGASALENNINGVANTAIGYQSLQSSIGAGYNVAVGYQTLNSLTGSSYNNLALGNSSLFNLATGQSNSGIGARTLYELTNGDYNTTLGRSSGYSLDSGSYNVYIGYEADLKNDTGSYNTIVGAWAGRTSANIFASHNKSGCVFLGYAAGFNEKNSNKLYIENSNSNEPLIGGDFSTDELELNAKVNIRDALHLNPSVNPPALGIQGDMYMDTDGFLYIHNGTVWKQVAFN